MKKTKIFAASLAAMICAGSLSLSGLSANAVAGFSYDLQLSESGYTFVEYSGVWMGSGYRPAAIFQKIDGYRDGYTGIIEATLLWTNCTTLTISEDGLETFEAIYAEYEEALDFDYYGSENDVLMDTGLDSVEEDDDIGCVKVYMHDAAPVTETISSEPVELTTKEDTLLELCTDLQSAGVLLAAEYHATEWMCCPGRFSQTITVTNLAEGEADAIQEIVSAYDDDAVVTEGIVVTDYIAEEDNVYGYTITPVEDYTAYGRIGSALRTAYPDATVGASYMLFEDTSSTQSGSIDLLSALSDGDDEETSAAIGDINLDGIVNMADVIRLNKYVGGTITLRDQELACADCYADGSIDGSDALALLQYMIAAVDTLPVTVG